MTTGKAIQPDQPPSDTAKAKWQQQLTATTTAGTNAWKAPVPANVVAKLAADPDKLAS